MLLAWLIWPAWNMPSWQPPSKRLLSLTHSEWRRHLWKKARASWKRLQPAHWNMTLHRQNKEKIEGDTQQCLCRFQWLACDAGQPCCQPCQLCKATQPRWKKKEDWQQNHAGGCRWHRPPSPNGAQEKACSSLEKEQSCKQERAREEGKASCIQKFLEKGRGRKVPFLEKG